MKKRLFATVLACLLLFVCSGTAFATTGDIQPYDYGTVKGGLTSQGNGKYILWGTINGSPGDSLKIRVELYTSSGSYVTETSSSGQGPTITAQKTVSLASGSYTIYIYGTTSTHTPTKTIPVTI